MILADVGSYTDTVTLFEIFLSVLSATVRLYLVKFKRVTFPAETLASCTAMTGFTVVVGAVVTELIIVLIDVEAEVEEVDAVVEVLVEVEVEVEVEVVVDCVVVVPSIMPPLVPDPLFDTVVVAVDVEVVAEVVVVEVVVGEDIVTMLSSMLFSVTGVEAESVMRMFPDIALPASAAGISHRKVLLVPVIPPYNAFARTESVIELKIW